jgi:hypothetical protein
MVFTLVTETSTKQVLVICLLVTLDNLRLVRLLEELDLLRGQLVAGDDCLIHALDLTGSQNAGNVIQSNR